MARLPPLALRRRSQPEPASEASDLAKAGEPEWNRTTNQQIKSLLLCQLSYGPTTKVGYYIVIPAQPAAAARVASV